MTRIKEIIRERKITELYHFTRIENLESIMEHGICSLVEMQKNGIEYTKNDYNRYDRRLDCSCVTISYPNTDLLKSYKRKDGGHWVMIVLDPSTLYENRCYFAEHNAATRTIASEISTRTDAASFENMFHREVNVRLVERTESFCRFGLRGYPNLTTSPQAEVLVKGKISTDMIKQVIFENIEEAIEYKSLLERKAMKYCVNEKLFKMNRDQWIKEQREESEMERMFEKWLKKSAS